MGATLLYLLLVWLYAWCVNDEIYFYEFLDPIKYLLMAKSLSQGSGYAIIGLDPPVPYTLQPVLFPFLTSLIIRLFGMHVPLIKAMQLVFYFVGFLALIDWARLRNEAGVGALAALLALSTPYAVAFSQVINSEFPYVGFSLATLWCFERFIVKGKNLWGLVPVVLLGLAAFYTRSIGLVLIAAMIASLALDRRIKLTALYGRAPVLAFTGLLAAGALAWYARCYWAVGINGFEYFHEFLGIGRQPDPESVIGMSSMGQRVWRNGPAYVGMLSQFLLPFPLQGWAAKALGAVPLLLIGVGFFHGLIHKRSAAEIYLLLYVALIVMWDCLDERFLLPIFALLFFYMLRGLALIGSWAGLRARNPMALGVGTTLLLLALSANLSHVVVNADGRGLKFHQRFELIHEFEPPWFNQANLGVATSIGPKFKLRPTNQYAHHMLALFLWIRDYVPAGSRFYVDEYSYFHFVTGARTVDVSARDFQSEDLVSMLEQRRIDYVCTTELLPYYSTLITHAIKADPQRFELKTRIFNSKTALYQFHWRGRPEDENP